MDFDSSFTIFPLIVVFLLLSTVGTATAYDSVVVRQMLVKDCFDVGYTSNLIILATFSVHGIS